MLENQQEPIMYPPQQAYYDIHPHTGYAAPVVPMTPMPLYPGYVPTSQAYSQYAYPQAQGDYQAAGPNIPSILQQELDRRFDEYGTILRMLSEAQIESLKSKIKELEMSRQKSSATSNKSIQAECDLLTPVNVKVCPLCTRSSNYATKDTQTKECEMPPDVLTLNAATQTDDIPKTLTPVRESVRSYTYWRQNNLTISKGAKGRDSRSQPRDGNGSSAEDEV